MITEGRIIRYEGNQLLIECREPIDRELAQKLVRTVEIRLDDGRTISAAQRRKIFAMIRDIALWSGHEPEYLRMFLEWDFCLKKSVESFSLHDVDMSTAREFITYLIEFCFRHNVPTKDTLLNETDDIGKYLYLCLEHRKCAICNAPAQVHHVDRIGMGRNREEMVHVGLNAIALCPIHHEEAHMDERGLFQWYHVYGIKLDRYLCDKLKLGRSNTSLGPEGSLRCSTKFSYKDV